MQDPEKVAVFILAVLDETSLSHGETSSVCCLSGEPRSERLSVHRIPFIELGGFALFYAGFSAEAEKYAEEAVVPEGVGLFGRDLFFDDDVWNGLGVAVDEVYSETSRIHELICIEIYLRL